MDFMQIGEILNDAYSEYYTAKQRWTEAVRDYNRGNIENIPEEVTTEYSEVKERYINTLTEAVRELMETI